MTGLLNQKIVLLESFTKIGVSYINLIIRPNPKFRISFNPLLLKWGFRSTLNRSSIHKCSRYKGEVSIPITVNLLWSLDLLTPYFSLEGGQVIAKSSRKWRFWPFLFFIKIYYKNPRILTKLHRKECGFWKLREGRVLLLSPYVH